LSDKLEKFFESQGIDTYGDLYTLDGTPLGNSHSAGLISTNAVTALAATDTERAKKFVEAIWELEPPSGRDRYYGGLLYYMSMLHCSGEFKIWKPE
ncbi:MAG: hypothetical protein P8016_14225, partial [Sedimentisphaerales bacterium]